MVTEAEQVKFSQRYFWHYLDHAKIDMLKFAYAKWDFSTYVMTYAVHEKAFNITKGSSGDNYPALFFSDIMVLS